MPTSPQEPAINDPADTSLRGPYTSHLKGVAPVLAVRPPEAARMLSLTVRTVKGMMRRGEIQSVRLSQNVTLIPVQAIREWLDDQLQTGGGR